ncbi:MAG: competence/damage-inducible protein A [Eubacteriales bacterium]
MVAEVISVGTELLLGMIVNTNASYLAEQCAKYGYRMYHQSVVGDNEQRLEAALVTALERSDVILLSGGLGPTQDDMTKETVAKVCKEELVMHEPSKKAIQTYFNKRGLQLTDNNWKQALILKGCTVLDNDNGTAPGLIVEYIGKKIILLPGPPHELIAMFEGKVAPYLQELQEEVFYTKTVKVCGIGESQLETMIEDLIDTQTNPTIATYAKLSEVHVRVTANARDKKTAKLLVKPVVKELEKRLGNRIYSKKDQVTIEEVIVNILQKRSYTIATAESCTGGMLANRIIQVPGVSSVYKQGYITYADDSKSELLGVKKKLLKEYGAVSEPVAKAMAKGACKYAQTNVAISITGIAGPDGGTRKKPVGLVYIACCINERVWVKSYQFSGNRKKIRESSAINALILLRDCLLEEK